MHLMSLSLNTLPWELRHPDAPEVEWTTAVFGPDCLVADLLFYAVPDGFMFSLIEIGSVEWDEYCCYVSRKSLSQDQVDRILIYSILLVMSLELMTINYKYKYW